MILPEELQQLQEERSRIEDDMSVLKEQQRKLEEKAKDLEIRIMEELKCRNAETRNAISHLESTIGFLERKLEQITQKPAQDEKREGTASEKCSSEVPSVAPEVNPELTEGSLQEYAAAPVSPDDFSETSEETDSELEQREGKKKHKFF